MTKKIILGLALVAGSVSYAQNAAATEEVYGLLGQRYAQAGFAAFDINHSSANVYAAGLVVNSPVTKNIDVSLAYTNAWVEGQSEVNGHALDLGATYFLTEGQFKPFGTVTLGYVWPDLGDELTWSGDAGVEYVFNKNFSAQLFGSYEDNFKKHNEGEFSGTVSANYWVNEKFGAGLATTLLEQGDLRYTATVAFKF